MAEEWGNNLVLYLYDADGSPIGMQYRNTSYAEGKFDTYWFEKNLQGDIVAIYNDSGVRIGTYTYDAWGNFTVSTASGITSLEHSIVHTYNPFRYRGYYYDVDMGMYYLQSRYYNPQWGRFLNADGQIADIGGEILGYNQFSYCFNDPINMDDKDGNWPQKLNDAVKWVAKNVVRPVVKKIQNTLSTVDLTYSTGINVSGTPSGVIFNGQIGVSMDTKGNIAIQSSGGGGFTGGTPAISFSSYKSMTNAPSINELNGLGYQVGGSAIILVDNVPVAVGGDFNIIPDLERNRTYYGATVTRGVAIGKPGGEFHVEWGTTTTLPKTQFNIFDVARDIYAKIMEW